MAPVVVKFTDKYDTKQVSQNKDDKKVLKSGKPISLKQLKEKRELHEKQLLKKSKGGSEEDKDNIKNDLALERLLSESHILSSSQSRISGADLTLQTLDHDNPIGNARVRTLHSRLNTASQINGANGGVKKLEKMPMNMRKGLVKHMQQKIAKHEREAKEAGIVLAKQKKNEFRQLNQGRGASDIRDKIGYGTKASSSSTRIRDRGLKINSIGKSTRNGLVISKADIDRFTTKPDQGKKKKNSRGSRY